MMTLSNLVELLRARHLARISVLIYRIFNCRQITLRYVILILHRKYRFILLLGYSRRTRVYEPHEEDDIRRHDEIHLQ